MFEYWPGAEAEEGGSPSSKSMAGKMNSYRKYVFSHSGEHAPLAWNNAELVTAQGDDDIVRVRQ